jgi:hypothetical protein
MVGIQTPDNTQNAVGPQVGEAPQPEQGPQAQAIPPIRKTHITDAFSQLLKSLPLLARLRKNKIIEADNEKRIQKTLDNARDPITFPDAGSECASFVTIDSTEMSLLATPNFVDVVQKEAPFYILQKISALKFGDKEKRKRDGENADTTDGDEARDLKRRTMSGAVLVSRCADEPLETNFPDIMFTTEDMVALPLSFFTHRSLQYILDYTALLPTRKIHGGDAKSCTIIDVDKLTSTLGGELSLNYGQFMEAAYQMLRFQALRDKDALRTNDLNAPKVTLSWTATWRKHFAFFKNQPDAERYYEDWKCMEFELRQERRRHNFAYDPEHYKLKYAMAKNNAMQREDFAKRESKLKSSQDSALFPALQAPPFLCVPLRGPFPMQEPGHRRLLVSAYSAPTKTTSHTTPERRRNLRMVNPSGPKSMPMASFAALTDKKSASASILPVEQHAQVLVSTLPRTELTSAPSVVKSLTMPSPGPAAPTIEDFLAVSLPPRLSYSSFNIIRRPAFDPNRHIEPHIFERIITPYDPDAFEFLLGKHNIESYPHLVHNLRHGFPLGDHPNLASTYIIPNHPSVFDYPEDIQKYLSTEIAADRMSGPYSSHQVEKILRGPFQSSPFIVSVQPQGPGEPDKIRICRHLSKATKYIASMNSFISKEDFPTRFDTASRVADIVSVLILCGHLCHLWGHPHRGSSLVLILSALVAMAIGLIPFFQALILSWSFIPPGVFPNEVLPSPLSWHFLALSVILFHMRIKFLTIIYQIAVAPPQEKNFGVTKVQRG